MPRRRWIASLPARPGQPDGRHGRISIPPGAIWSPSR